MKLYDWQGESLSGDSQTLAERLHELQTEVVALTYALHAAELQEMLDKAHAKHRSVDSAHKTKRGGK